MGVLSPVERDLVAAYEIENLSGEELGRREGLSAKALSYKVRAALARVTRAFQGIEKVPRRGKSSPE